MAKTSDLPLNELYAKEKITKSVEVAIQAKENFNKLSHDYCMKICKLKCKRPEGVDLLNKKVDILIIQDHSMPRGKYDKTDDGSEKIQQGIIDFVCEKAKFRDRNITYKVVNLLKCAPHEKDFPKGKAPTITTLEKCKPYLLQEIATCTPKVIISLSTAVTKALGYKKHSNTNNRGEIIDNRIVITLHPRVLSMIRQNASGAMWGNDYFDIIRRDFEKAAKLVIGELYLKTLEEGVEEQKKNIFICRSLEDIQNVIRTINSLPDGYVVSCDTETTSLDPFLPEAKLLCIQFGWKDPETGVIIARVIPLWHRANTWYNADIAWKLVVPILISKNIIKIGHNFKFDYLYIYHTTGVRVEGFEFDTMLTTHALDSGLQGCFSLKAAIWDWAPDINIGGYEGLLPKLSKKKDIEEEQEDEENVEA